MRRFQVGLRSHCPVATPFSHTRSASKSFANGCTPNLLGNRLYLDASVFHYDYSDLQLRNAVISGTATLVTINNAGHATITAGELDDRFSGEASASMEP